MSHANSADFVAYEPAPAPRPPDPDYLPACPIKRANIYAAFAAEVEDYKSYIKKYNWRYRARLQQTSHLIENRRAACRKR